jgi:hypothetical protein
MVYDGNGCRFHRYLPAGGKKATRSREWPKSREVPSKVHFRFARLVPGLACNAGVLSDP